MSHKMQATHDVDLSRGDSSTLVGGPVFLTKPAQAYEDQTVTTSLRLKQELPMLTSNKPTPPTANSNFGLWELVEVLESCFPAVAPAINFAMEFIEPKTPSDRFGNLLDIAARYVEKILDRLSS